MVLSSSSVSKILLVLEVKDKFKLDVELKRHLAPTLIGKISRSLPLHGNSHIFEKSCVYFETSIDAGIERGRREFKKGDISFLSVGHALCFFHTDSNVSKEMAPVGKIIGESKLLEMVESGDEIMLYCETG